MSALCSRCGTARTAVHRTGRDRPRFVCRPCENERLRKFRDGKSGRGVSPIQRAAHRAVEAALRAGRLSRMPCEVCAATPAQAHHDDYARPLDVVWLCPAHHKARHRELRLNAA